MTTTRNGANISFTIDSWICINMCVCCVSVCDPNTDKAVEAGLPGSAYNCRLCGGWPSRGHKNHPPVPVWTVSTAD